MIPRNGKKERKKERETRGVVIIEYNSEILFAWRKERGGRGESRVRLLRHAVFFRERVRHSDKFNDKFPV